jgi:tRNA G46 methylase TrmB
MQGILEIGFGCGSASLAHGLQPPDQYAIHVTHYPDTLAEILRQVEVQGQDYEIVVDPGDLAFFARLDGRKDSKSPAEMMQLLGC